MRFVMWLLAFGGLALAVWVWPEVPARVPVHFGPDGEPTQWAARSAAEWFGLPVVGLVLAAGLDVLTRWALRHPEAPAFNLPNKEAILRLPEARRAPVLARVGAIVYALGAACLVAFGLIQVGIWREAQGGIDGTFWVLGGGLAAIVLPMSVVVIGVLRVDAEVRRQRAAG